MADDHSLAIQSSGMDYPEHERTYRSFLAFVKWGTIALVVLLILMAYFLL